MNDEAPIIDQMQGHWQKLCALVVWKLAKEGVTISADDMRDFPADRHLLTQGKMDGIKLKIVTKEEALQIREFNRSQQGRA